MSAIPPNFGRSSNAVTTSGAGSQLARVELENTGDFTVYLFGWNTPSDTNNVLGRYNVTHGSGGVSTIEQVNARARGTVLHFSASLVQVDTLPNQSAPLNSIAKARIAFGRPVPFSLPLQLTATAGVDGTVVRIPDWTTNIRVVSVFNDSAAPPVAVTDCRIIVANANDPTAVFAGQGFRVLDFSDQQVPLTIGAGFLKLHGGATAATVNLVAEGIR